MTDSGRSHYYTVTATPVNRAARTGRLLHKLTRFRPITGQVRRLGGTSRRLSISSPDRGFCRDWPVQRERATTGHSQLVPAVKINNDNNVLAREACCVECNCLSTHTVNADVYNNNIN